MKRRYDTDRLTARAWRHLRTPLLTLLLGVLVSVAVPAEEITPEAESTLPPESTWLLYPTTSREPVAEVVEVEPERLDLDRLSDEVAAMARAAERIRTALRQNQISQFEGVIEETIAERAPARRDRERRAAGEPVASTRLGSNHLQVQRFTDGSIEVTARVSNERLHIVYGELLYLLGYRGNDGEVGNRSHRIDFHVADLPWEDALTRLLGQVGLGWRLQPGDRGQEEVVIFEIHRQPKSDRTRLERRAEAALIQASLGRDNAMAAEALFMRADRERRLARYAEEDQRSSRYRAALVGYLDLLHSFQEQANDDPTIRQWMRRCFLGMADCFLQTENYHEARTQYLNYIAHAEDDDPRLPEVHLLAAEASQQLGRVTGDQGAFVRAMELLDTVIHTYQNHSEASVFVTRAHTALGLLHFERGEYEAAKVQLMRYKDAIRESEGHHLLAYLGACDYELAKQARLDFRHADADQLMTSARTYFQEIAAAYRQGYRERPEEAFRNIGSIYHRQDQTDPLVADRIYWESFYRIGLTYVGMSEPDFVAGLFAFLEARRVFPNAPIEGLVLVHIAHCFSELESDAQAIATLHTLLDRDRLDTAEQQIADLLGTINASLSDYPSPIRAKVLFFIAQAHRRAVERDRSQSERLDRAVHAYTRVLEDENPDPDLRIAARIGRARTRLLDIDPDPAVADLRAVLRSEAASGRDRAFAAKLLGDHYRAQGDLRRAIQAYSGEISQ